MDEYARSYGHEPTESWILVVHADNSSEFYPFEDPTTMWCCDRKGELRNMINKEREALTSASTGSNGERLETLNPEARARVEALFKAAIEREIAADNERDPATISQDLQQGRKGGDAS